MDERPSIWGIGLGAGIFTAGVLLLVAILNRWAFELAWFGVGLSVIVMAWCGLPVLVWLVTTGWGVFQTVYTWRHRNDKPSALLPAPPAAVQPAIVIRRVGGTVNGMPREELGREIDLVETRPARWVAWQAESLELLDWYVAAGRSLLSDDLVGPGLAFANRPDWVRFTDEWARQRLAIKANGKPTQLAGPLPAIRARIERGLVEWSLEADPPPIAPPRPNKVATVEAQIA